MSDRMLKERVKIAQMRLFLANVKTNVFAATIAATIVLLMLLQQSPKAILLPWYSVFIVLSAGRYYHLKHYDKKTLSIENINQSFNSLFLLTVGAGCLWGALGFAYVEENSPVINVILLMIFTGLCANASATMSSLLPVYLGFALPILIPMAYKFYSLDDDQYDWITALILLYTSVSIIITKRIRASMRQSILVQFENLDLIESLKIENSKTEQALRKAEQANLAKTRFFAAASHDLRQPLQSLSMFTTTLATRTESAAQKNIVSHIANSVRSLEELFNALLDIAALDAGTVKLREQHFYLRPLIDELSVELVELTHGQPLTLEVDVGDHIVRTDPMLLSRIIRNLVDNAVRYTDEGTVKIASALKDNRVSLSVSDTGVGIPAEKISRIFEEFVQLNNPGRDRNKGLGLGLSIVSRSCELLDIRLELQSEIGKGSVFSVSIEVGEAAQVISPSTEIQISTSALDGMFVLVVDDEEDIRLSMEALLSVWGCTVMVASSGQEAIDQLIEYESFPDAVITDYRLQDNETGGDTIKLIRNYCRSEIPAIIITGDIAPERLLEIDKLKLPVLHKPCDAAQLQNLLRSFLKS